MIIIYNDAFYCEGGVIGFSIVKDTAVERGETINWSLAARIKVKVRNYLGNQAIEGLEMPEKSHY